MGYFVFHMIFGRGVRGLGTLPRGRVPWVVLDSCVGSPVGVELGGVAVCVGAEPAVAPQLGVEQGALRAGPKRLAPCDEAGAALGPAGEVDTGGELRDLGEL